MNNADGSPAKVNLQGAIDMVGLMYGLGFENLSEREFWEKRAIIDQFERGIQAAEREKYAKIAESEKGLLPDGNSWRDGWDAAALAIAKRIRGNNS